MTASKLLLPCAAVAAIFLHLEDAPANAMPAPTQAQLERCPLLDGVDFSQFSDGQPPSAESDRQMEEMHRATRGEAFSPPADSEIVLRIWAPAAPNSEEPADTSSYVWKEADGSWNVSRIDHLTRRIPPPPDENGVPASPEEVYANSHHIYEGVLPPRLSERIESTLADPCFELQPDDMPTEVRMLAGKEPPAPCWHITGGMLEIFWRDGRRRSVFEPCRRFYAAGIIGAVMYARPEGATD